MAVIGIVAASRFFGWEGHRAGVRGEREAAHRIALRYPFLYRASLNKWWFDELNHLLFIVIGGRVAGGAVVVRPERHRRRRSTASARSLQQHRRAAFAVSRPACPELRAGHRHRAARHGRLVPRDRGPLTMTIEVSTIPIVSLITFLPLAGALIIAFLPRSAEAATRWIALATALVTWVASLMLLIGFSPEQWHRRGALLVRRDGGLDPAVRHPVQGRRGRPVGRAGRPDDDADRGSRSSPASGRSRRG